MKIDDMGSVPYGLSEGLFLEDSLKLIPWFNNFRQIQSFWRCLLPKPAYLYWDSESIFGGLKVSVTAYENGLFHIGLKDTFNHAKHEYEATIEIIKGKLGEPHENGNNEDVYASYPWVRWTWGSVRINITIAERFMEYVTFSISNRP